MEVYKITNIVNGKIYIGKTCKTAQQRFNRHIKQSSGNVKGTDYFHLALKKYGSDKFQLDILETNIENKEELNKREIYWISKYNSTDNKIGYNLLPGGTGGKLPDEIYKQIGNKLKGRKQTQEHIAQRVKSFKKNGANIGRRNGVFKPGVRLKISNSLKEYYKNNIESRTQISNSLKEYYRNNTTWNKGIKDCYSAETKNSISNSLKEYYKNNPKKLPSFRGHHHTERTRNRLKNKHWYNDGVNTYFCEDSIAELNNYKKGRLNYRRKENGK